MHLYSLDRSENLLVQTIEDIWFSDKDFKMYKENNTTHKVHPVTMLVNVVSQSLQS